MTFRIPNADDAFNPNQAEPDAVDVDILVAGIAGDGVVSGCAVADQTSGDLDVVVDAGTIAIGGDRVAVAGGALSLSPAESNPRFDLIVAHDDGSISAVTGTGHAEPVFPGVPSGAVALAAVYVPAETSEITPDMIVDKRCIVPDPVFDHVDIDSGTLTASDPALTRAQTWNNALVDFIGSDTNITDTASGGGSLIERWRINGSVMASISKAGALVLAAGATLGGILALPAGAVGAPSLHLGDATTGIYRPASNQIGIAASGVNVATFSLTQGIVLPLASGSNIWNVFASGTAPNHFAGIVGIGTQSIGDAALSVRLPTTVSNANIAGVNVLITPSGTGLTSTSALSVRIDTPNTVATYSNLTALNIANFQRGAASTISAIYGVRVQNQTATANTKIAAFLQMDAGTNWWNVYASGTANNAFVGNVRIGSVVAPTVALDVTGAALISSTLGVTGTVGIGAAAVASRALTISAAATSSTDAYGAVINNVITTSGAGVGTLWGLRVVPTFVGGTPIAQIGVDVNNIAQIGTAVVAGYRSQVTSGTGKWNFLASTNASSAFLGNVRIGSVVSPTVALDVTGDALISSTLGVSGTLTLSGSAANIALGSNFISNGGTDAGLSFDGSNNATFSGSITSSALTSGRIPYVTTGGLIADSSDFRWSVSNKYLIFSGNNAWALGPNQGILFANGTTGATLSGNGTFDVTLRNRSGTDVFAILGNTASVLLNASGSALATNATDGFTYLPTCAGTPTGTPTAVTGAAPAVIDETNHKLYFYTGGAWRDAGP